MTDLEGGNRNGGRVDLGTSQMHKYPEETEAIVGTHAHRSQSLKAGLTHPRPESAVLVRIEMVTR